MSRRSNGRQQPAWVSSRVLRVDESQHQPCANTSMEKLQLSSRTRKQIFWYLQVRVVIMGFLDRLYVSMLGIHFVNELIWVWQWHVIVLCCECRVNTRMAVRATTAAPTYFTPVQFEGGLYCDGALVANNPTAIALQEAKVSHLTTFISLVDGVSRLPHR